MCFCMLLVDILGNGQVIGVFLILLDLREFNDLGLLDLLQYTCCICQFQNQNPFLDGVSVIYHQTWYWYIVSNIKNITKKVHVVLMKIFWNWISWVIVTSFLLVPLLHANIAAMKYLFHSFSVSNWVGFNMLCRTTSWRKHGWNPLIDTCWSHRIHVWYICLHYPTFTIKINQMWVQILWGSLKSDEQLVSPL